MDRSRLPPRGRAAGDGTPSIPVTDRNGRDFVGMAAVGARGPGVADQTRRPGVTDRAAPAAVPRHSNSRRRAMNSPRESLGAAAVRILSRMIDRPRAAKLRRFRPLAEPMEARAVLSQVALTQTIVAPVAMT